MLSLIYATFAYATSIQFSAARFNSDAELTTIYSRTRPSRIAGVTAALLRLTLPMHCLVTAVFWPLIYPRAERSRTSDTVYLILAHGVTLVCLLGEGLLSRIHFDRSALIL